MPASLQIRWLNCSFSGSSATRSAIRLTTKVSIELYSNEKNAAGSHEVYTLAKSLP